MAKVGRKKLKKSEKKVNKSVVVHPKFIKRIKKDFTSFSAGISAALEAFYADKE